jgi:hypothetical protein
MLTHASRCVLAFISLLGAVACLPTEPIIDGFFVGIHVRGSVRTPSGDPVVGATLVVHARAPETCTGKFADAPLTTSDSTGAFARTLSTWSSPRDVCIYIVAVPPEAAGLVMDFVSVPARLEHAFDTLVVEVVLPAAL